MKKNVLPFILDTDLIEDVGCLLQFVRQPIPLEEFFKRFSEDILNTKLDQLKLEYKDGEKSLIIKKNDSHLFNLTNEHLSSFGITISDSKQLVRPLIKCKKDSPNLNLKDILTKLITANFGKIKQINVNSSIDLLKNTILKHPDNENKQTEINIFFKFLKKLIAQETSKPTTLSANAILEAVYSIFSLWFTSSNDISIFEPEIYYSKKYNELDALIQKLYSFNDINFLAGQLSQLNNNCLQKLLNIDSSEEAIKIIENFQSQASKIIEQSIKDNPLSLEQLNIFYKILNAIARLIPSFILSKNTRTNFFRRCTPQHKLLAETVRQFSPSI